MTVLIQRMDRFRGPILFASKIDPSDDTTP